MKLHNLPKSTGRKGRTKRLGCGRGSGHGKTSGRGHKGGNARSGYSMPSNYSGIPMYRRFPSRGFNNANFKKVFEIVNLCDLALKYPDGFEGVIDNKCLFDSGLIRKVDSSVKLLGAGEISCKYNICVSKISASAKSKIESLGGSVDLK